MDFQWLSSVEPIIKHAGKQLMSYYGQDMVKRYKKEGGLVTDADLFIEQYLMSELPQVQPKASFVTEESGAQGDQNQEWQWVIDPIDGTTNFTYGLPYFCISVALTKNHKPIMGVVYAPVLDRFFYAEEGKGSWLNGKQVTIKGSESLSRALVNIGVPYKKADWTQLTPIIEQICKASYTIRHFGAIALDLAHLAAGNLDGVLFFRLSWWDVAAGMLLVSEAGGIITDFKGNNLGPDYKSCVAGSEAVHASLSALISQSLR